MTSPSRDKPEERKPATLDWTEDAAHENGKYWNQCIECGHVFIGHKRRVVCKLCANPSSPESPNSGMSKAERAEFNDCNRPFARKLEPTPESPTLETLLENFGKAYWRMEEEQFNGDSGYRSSREAVTKYVEGLEAKAALSADADFWAMVARDEQGFVRTQDEWDTLAAYAREQTARISLLEANALTVEEATIVLGEHPRWHQYRPSCGCVECEAITAKLRRLQSDSERKP